MDNVTMKEITKSINKIGKVLFEMQKEKNLKEPKLTMIYLQ